MVTTGKPTLKLNPFLGIPFHIEPDDQCNQFLHHILPELAAAHNTSVMSDLEEHHGRKALMECDEMAIKVAQARHKADTIRDDYDTVYQQSKDLAEDLKATKWKLAEEEAKVAALLKRIAELEAAQQDPAASTSGDRGLKRWGQGRGSQGNFEPYPTRGGYSGRGIRGRGRGGGYQNMHQAIKNIVTPNLTHSENNWARYHFVKGGINGILEDPTRGVSLSSIRGKRFIVSIIPSNRNNALLQARLSIPVAKLLACQSLYDHILATRGIQVADTHALEQYSGPEENITTGDVAEWFAKMGITTTEAATYALHAIHWLKGKYTSTGQGTEMREAARYVDRWLAVMPDPIIINAEWEVPLVNERDMAARQARIASEAKAVTEHDPAEVLSVVGLAQGDLDELPTWEELLAQYVGEEVATMDVDHTGDAGAAIKPNDSTA
jgi:hypothetical protein